MIWTPTRPLPRWILDTPLLLVRSLAQKKARAERELLAAINLARLQGESNLQIAHTMGLEIEQFIELYGRG